MLLIVIFAIILFIVVAKSAVVVPAGNEYVVEKLGRFSKTLKPGLHFLTPFVDIIRFKFSTKETPLKIPTFAEPDKQQLPLTIESELVYQITDSEMVYKNLSDFSSSLAQLTQGTTKGAIQEYSFDEALSQRKQIADQITRRIADTAKKWGIKIISFSIQSITPPAEVIRVFEERAEKEKMQSASS